jgi:ribosomal protein S18 acetylase RimI-like enzyme
VTSSLITPAELACRLEQHAVDAWPAAVTERAPDGWVLRATPGLDRGRSNHALTPCRAVGVDEVPGAVARVEAFARRHGIHPGIQVSPLGLQDELMSELERRGWGTGWPLLVRVLAAPVALVASPSAVSAVSGVSAVSAVSAASGTDTARGVALEVSDHATPEWLAAWARCEPGRDVEAHARTVFPRMAGRASFARLGDLAVCIAAEGDGLVGLFCLAVDPARRRGGVGTALVRALLARSAAEVAYLQVEASNAPAIGLYERLGFGEAFRYCHRVAPRAWKETTR